MLAAGVEGFRCKRDGALSDLFGVVSIHEIPIDIADLSYSRDDLRFKCDLSNLLIGPGNSQIAQVWPGSKSSEQLLLEDDTASWNKAADSEYCSDCSMFGGCY